MSYETTTAKCSGAQGPLLAHHSSVDEKGSRVATLQSMRRERAKVFQLASFYYFEMLDGVLRGCKHSTTPARIYFLLV